MLKCKNCLEFNLASMYLANSCVGLRTITAFKSLEIIIITLIERPPNCQPKYGQVGVFQVTSTIIDVWKTPTLGLSGMRRRVTFDQQLF